MNNKELTQKIINCFDFWELEDTEQDTQETFDILERNDPTELKQLKENFIQAKNGLIEETSMAEILAELDNRICLLTSSCNKNYAVVHHSEMTDIELYFVASDQTILLDNWVLIEKFIHSETAFDYELYGKALEDKGIKYYNSETDRTPQGAEIIKKYSYRF